MRVALLLAIAAVVGSTVRPPPTAAHREPSRARRPPQFIVASFDGSGGARLWAYWRAVARSAHAHFTFFVSGVYLLDWAHHDGYVPPRNARGASAIGFAPDRAWIAAMRRQMAGGYAEGNEIGTHYNGHFCGPGGVATWAAADWSRELDEFDRIVFRHGSRLPFGPSEIVGGRTPCLEGNLRLLYPLLAHRGLRYDASATARLGTWPSRRAGIWSFPLADVPFVGHTFRVVSMDYNFMANQVGERSIAGMARVRSSSQPPPPAATPAETAACAVTWATGIVAAPAAPAGGPWMLMRF